MLFGNSHFRPRTSSCKLDCIYKLSLFVKQVNKIYKCIYKSNHYQRDAGKISLFITTLNITVPMTKIN